MKARVSRPGGKPVRDRASILQLFNFLLAKASALSGRRWDQVSLVLMDDVDIAGINRIHLGHDFSTDVITYSYDPMPGLTGDTLSGEIFVNLERAQRLGGRFGGANRELGLYIAHGCDHLAGENDGTTAERQRMRRRELRWLAEAARLNLLSGWSIS